VVGGLLPVLPAQITPPGALVYVAVLDVGDRFFGSAGAAVEAEQRLGAHEPAPLDELVGAELVRLERVPGPLQHGRTLVLRPHAVEPVVARDEVAARVAHDRHAEPLDLGGHVLAEPARVREARARLVDARVHRPAEVLQEGAEEPAVQLRAVPGRLQDHAGGSAGLRVADAAQPGPRGERGPGAAKPRHELTAAWRLVHEGFPIAGSSHHMVIPFKHRPGGWAWRAGRREGLRAWPGSGCC